MAKLFRTVFIGILVALCVIISGCGDASTAPSGPTATHGPPTATHAPTVLLQLSGGDNSATGDTRSQPFNVTGDWQIIYTCQTDADHDTGLLFFVVHNGNGSDATMSAALGPPNCPKGASNGTVNYHDPNANGSPQPRYLTVTAAGVTWSLTVNG